MDVVPVDIVFSLIFLILAVRCVFRGFVAEFMSIQAVLGGLILAFIFSPIGAAFLDGWRKPSPWNRLIAFLVIFLVVYLICKILERLLTGFFEWLHLEKLDRALGLFLGIIEGILVVLVVILVIEIQPFINSDSILGGSIVTKWLRILLPGGLRMVGEEIGVLI